MKTITLAGLRPRREALGLTQQAVADRAGVDRSNIANWETGRSLPMAALLPALAMALECSIDELYQVPESGTGEAAE